MLQIDPIYKIIDILEKNIDIENDRELLNDINTIDDMIKGKIVSSEKLVNDICNKYKDELTYLANLEHNLRNFQINNNNSRNSFEQYLLNVRHALVRVQIMRLLDRKGKKMLEDDLINNDNENLYIKLIDLLYN